MTWKAKVLLFCVLIYFDCGDAKIFPTRCGIRSSTGGLIRGGTKSKFGQWPWLGVWCYGDTTEKCFCTASLITTQHAVTAAHCLYPKHEQFPTHWPETLLYFGRFDLMDDEEENSQVRKIVDVAIHNDWDPKKESYDADVAVLRLDKPVKFSLYIQPVCLTTAAEFVGGSAGGSVAGWGIAEGVNRSDILLFADIKSVSDEVCWDGDKRGHHFLEYLSSPRTFCGGNPEQLKGPCDGDSGKFPCLFIMQPKLINFFNQVVAITFAD